MNQDRRPDASRTLKHVSVVLLLAMGVDAAVSCIRLAVFGRHLLPQTENLVWQAILAAGWLGLAVVQHRRPERWTITVIVAAAIRLTGGLVAVYVSLAHKPVGFSLGGPTALHAWIMSIAIPSGLIPVNLRLLRPVRHHA